MIESPYVIVRTYRSRGEPCGARGCATEIQAGAYASVVVHEHRWLFDPEARDAQAVLCQACVGRLGDRARPTVLPEVLPDVGPFLYRGQPVDAF